MSAFFWPPTCENLTNILLYPLYLYFQLTFRHVLTMLAIFDCIFIAMASATFSLPLISSYWQVAFLLSKPNINVGILLNILKRYLTVFNFGFVFPWFLLFPTYFTCFPPSLPVSRLFFTCFIEIELYPGLGASPPISLVPPVSCLFHLFPTHFTCFIETEIYLQVWVHPHLFPWFLPIIQISLNGSIWSTVSVTVERYKIISLIHLCISPILSLRYISVVHPRHWMRSFSSAIYIVPVLLLSILWNVPRQFHMKMCKSTYWLFLSLTFNNTG